MDQKLARHFASVVFKSESQLVDIVHLLKQHCDDAEYKMYSKAIASVAATINLDLLNLIYKNNPEVQKDIEDTLDKFSVLI